MKAATGNRTKLYAATLLGIVAVWCVIRAVIPSGPASAPTSHAASSVAKTAAIDSLDPRLRLDLLTSSEDVRYEGKGKNIFRASIEMEPIEKVRVSPLLGHGGNTPSPQAHTAPPPPPINLKFFGLTSSKGEKPKAFLSQGEDVWIAREGDVVNRHYRLLRISPREVEVEDLLNNHRENIPLTQG